MAVLYNMNIVVWDVRSQQASSPFQPNKTLFLCHFCTATTAITATAAIGEARKKPTKPAARARSAARKAVG